MKLLNPSAILKALTSQMHWWEILEDVLQTIAWIAILFFSDGLAFAGNLILLGEDTIKLISDSITTNNIC